MAAGLGLLLLPCILGWMGAGDVKLLGAIGALQGPLIVLRAGLYGAVVGGLLSALVLTAARRRGELVGTAGRRTLPYGPALAVGTIIALLVP
jgi:prepilin peptidase CpaA